MMRTPSDPPHAAVAEFGADCIRAEGRTWDEGHGRDDYSPAARRQTPDNGGMRVTAARLLGVVALTLVGCDSSPTAPSTTTATVQFDYRAATALTPNLPASPQTCVSGVGRTHIHPSWRGFVRIDLQAVGATLWQITFTDVPIDMRLSLRVSDPNVCTENPTGAAARNVFVDDVLLVDIVPTPGTGTEPGLAFTVDADGTVTQ